MAEALSSSARASAFTRDYEYTIGDLAREFGVTLRTLRFYEDKGLLMPRRAGTTRVYSSRDRARLSIILKAKQLGFTLSEIQDIVAKEGEAGPADLCLSRDALEQQIAHLERQHAEIVDALAKLRAMQAGLRDAA
jgi:DNA-binding transcriptional MerR regulator